LAVQTFVCGKVPIDMVLRRLTTAQDAQTKQRNGSQAKDLKDRAIVITGAAQGVGQESATEIALQGAKLALGDQAMISSLNN